MRFSQNFSRTLRHFRIWHKSDSPTAAKWILAFSL